MDAIFVRTKDLNKKSVDTRLVAVCKRNKDTRRALDTLIKSYAMEGQWDPIYGYGKGVAGGKEYSFRIVNVAEAVLTPDANSLEELFQTV